MTTSRSAVFLVALAFLLTYCGNAVAQKVDMSSTSIEQQVLSLNFTNNGQHLAATVGQQIEITLGTVGPETIRRPAGLFPRNPTRERRAGIAAESGRPDVCLHFRGDCRRRGADQNSYYQFRKSRLDETTYFCGDDSCRIGCRHPGRCARIHDAGPSKPRAVEKRMDEPTQRRAADLHAVAAEADRGRSGTRGGQPGPIR